MSNAKVLIGLEVHCQLNSLSKIFCACRNPVNLKEEPEPNTLTCPTCIGLPGSKPQVNKKVIEMATKIALALNCKVSKEFFFSRKVYFFSDMCRNFQITQYEVPLAKDGWLEISTNGKTKKIGITRVHIEEDPAKLIHVGGLGGKYVLVDYNRSGIPLVEIVTEPDFSSPKEARVFLQKLATILEYLGVYDSTSRAVIKSDANISLEGGARIEVKNITGTKEIEQALNYEIIRQASLIKRGVKIKRETRAWVAELGVTQALRGKEEEEEYGYIFEGDLPKITLDKKLIENIRKQLPELPDQKFDRFYKQYKLPHKLVESLVSELEIANLFEQVAKKIKPKLAASWIAGPLKKTLNWHGVSMKIAEKYIKLKDLVEILKMVESDMISDTGGELVLREYIETLEDPKVIVERKALIREKVKLEAIIKKIIRENKKAAQDYKLGKAKAIHYLVGQVVRKTRGAASAKEVHKLLKRLIK